MTCSVSYNTLLPCEPPRLVFVEHDAKSSWKRARSERANSGKRPPKIIFSQRRLIPYPLALNNNASLDDRQVGSGRRASFLFSDFLQQFSRLVLGGYGTREARIKEEADTNVPLSALYPPHSFEYIISFCGHNGSKKKTNEAALCHFSSDSFKWHISSSCYPVMNAFVRFREEEPRYHPLVCFYQRSLVCEYGGSVEQYLRDKAFLGVLES
eukprot:scaffold8790_cov187-Amphora_coffeaeformis.AAC.3